MPQWIALAAHGLWVVGSNPTRVIGDVRKGIQPHLLRCCKVKSVPKKRNSGFLTGYRDFKRTEVQSVSTTIRQLTACQFEAILQPHNI